MELELMVVRRVDGTAKEYTAPTPESLKPDRKELREVTDALMQQALMVGDLSRTAYLSAATMLAVARTLERVRQYPCAPDLVIAACALMHAGRTTLDNGLMMQNWDGVRCGAVMIELTLRGLCATTGLPYDEILVAVAEGCDLNAMRAILRSVGHNPTGGDGDGHEGQPTEGVAGGAIGSAGL